MPKWLTTNRVVLFFHGLIMAGTIATVFVLAVEKSLPQSWQGDLTLALSIIGAMVTGSWAVVKFLDGSQKFDATPLGQTAEVRRLGLAPTPPALSALDEPIKFGGSATTTVPTVLAVPPATTTTPTVMTVPAADLEQGPDTIPAVEGAGDGAWLASRQPTDPAAPVEPGADPAVAS